MCDVRVCEWCVSARWEDVCKMRECVCGHAKGRVGGRGA